MNDPGSVVLLVMLGFVLYALYYYIVITSMTPPRRAERLDRALRKIAREFWRR